MDTTATGSGNSAPPANDREATQWRALPPARRLAQALDHMYLSRLLYIDSIVRQHPELDEAEARAQAIRMLVGE
jgi:hypothetical protein